MAMPIIIVKSISLKHMKHNCIPHVSLLFQQVMEILTHVNKRVKGQPSIKLPVKELLPLAAAMPPPAADPQAPSTSPAAQAMVRSFALVYLEMAFDRASPEERYEAVRVWRTPLSSSCQT